MPKRKVTGTGRKGGPGWSDAAREAAAKARGAKWGGPSSGSKSSSYVPHPGVTVMKRRPGLKAPVYDAVSRSRPGQSGQRPIRSTSAPKAGPLTRGVKPTGSRIHRRAAADKASETNRRIRSARNIEGAPVAQSRAAWPGAKASQKSIDRAESRKYRHNAPGNQVERSGYRNIANKSHKQLVDEQAARKAEHERRVKAGDERERREADPKVREAAARKLTRAFGGTSARKKKK